MKTESTRVMFPAPGLTELQPFEAPEITAPTDILIETEYSIVG